MRFAGEEELAARGLGDGCGDLMFFSSVLDFLYRLLLARSLYVVSSLVSCMRPVGRLALSSCRLIACSYCSHLVSWGVSFLISFTVSFCLFVSFFLLRSTGASRSIPCPPAHSLIVLSCRGVLLARLVFFSFVLSSCGYVMRCSCGAAGYRIIPMSVRLFPTARLAHCLPDPMSWAASMFVLRHPVMRR